MKLTPYVKRCLSKAAKNRGGISQARLARQFGIHKFYVQKTLKKEGLTYHKRRNAPDWTQETEDRQYDAVKVNLSRTLMKPSSIVKILRIILSIQI